MKKWGLRRLLGFGSVDSDDYSYISEFLGYMIAAILSCPIRLWIPRLLMTFWFIIKYPPKVVKEWRVLSGILKWEIWIPDWEETREEFFNRTKQVIAANSYQTDAPPGHISKPSQLQPEGQY